jgi:hypothetical protein
VVPSGELQEQADGVISLPCEYPGAGHSPTTSTRTKRKNTTVKARCLGSTNEPDAEPGNRCVERGSGVPKERADQDAKFVTFDTPFGEETKPRETLPGETDLE